MALCKKVIDKEFSDLYSDLLRISAAITAKARKRHDARMLVNEAYLEVIKKASKINDKKDVRAFAIKFIKSSVIWTDSAISKKGEGGKRRGESGEHVTVINELEIYKQDQSEIDFKIEENKRETSFLVLREHYASEVKNKVFKRLFEVYAFENVSTHRAVAKRFSISKDTAGTQIKNMLEDVRKFAKENNYIN